MDVLLYVFGNFFVSAAALILLKIHSPQDSKKSDASNHQKFRYQAALISRDAEILLFLSTLLRVYWSLSPPPVYYYDGPVVQYMTIFDLTSSLVLWSLVLYRGSPQRSAIGHHLAKLEVPQYFRWPVLLGVGLLCAFLFSVFVDPMASSLAEEQHDGEYEEVLVGWPMAEIAIMLNMFLDTLAMAPQMYVIKEAKHEISKETCHFVGLLSVARLLRCLFWGISGVQQMLFDHWTSLWPFVIPDLVHSLVMAEYTQVWLVKIKKDSVNLFGEMTEAVGML